MTEYKTITVDMTRVLNGLGTKQPNGYMSYSDEDKREAMHRINALFRKADPLSTIAMVSGWCPGMMKYSVAWHIHFYAKEMYENTSEGRIVKVI